MNRFGFVGKFQTKRNSLQIITLCKRYFGVISLPNSRAILDRTGFSFFSTLIFERPKATRNDGVFIKSPKA